MFLVFAFTSILLLASTFALGRGSWNERLKSDVYSVAADFDGEFGLYVKDLTNQGEFLYQASRNWALSSSIKVIVGAAVMNEIEQGKLTLDQKIGGLMDDMLLRGDESATDQLIRRVSLRRLNEFAKRHIPNIGPLTDLKQVWREIYMEAHVQAKGLSNADIRELNGVAREQRLDVLARKLYVGRQSLRVSSMDQARARYYARGNNTLDLKSFGGFIDRLISGQVLSPDSTRRMRSWLEMELSGEGTQKGRHCAAGVISDGSRGKNAVVVLCLEGPGFADDEMEDVFAKVNKALGRSGLF
ncbi:MAG: serine hydrolase [Bdellovibrionales bacterium]|nr:serine hydrolase [Bdellovibrionales bacterium]